jgi:hypothetical protein
MISASLEALVWVHLDWLAVDGHRAGFVEGGVNRDWAASTGTGELIQRVRAFRGRLAVDALAGAVARGIVGIAVFLRDRGTLAQDRGGELIGAANSQPTAWQRRRVMRHKVFNRL